MSSNHASLRLSLKDLPADERPQERLEKLGSGPLSDRELLALLLRSGTVRHDVLSLADSIIREAGNLAGLARWDVSDFQRIPGIGKVKALQLSVAIEIAQRISLGADRKHQPIDEPAKVWKLLYPKAISQTVEKVWVLCLDRKNRVIRNEEISSGTATGSLVHPREVFVPRSGGEQPQLSLPITTRVATPLQVRATFRLPEKSQMHPSPSRLTFMIM